MFEAHVLHLLRKYLGEYVHGLSSEALRISVWKGDVVLKDLKLKAEALNSLKLPVTVTAGFIGTITLKVPWKSLGKEPVIVLIDRVFILAHPAPDGQSLKDEDRERLFEAKLRQIEEAELATLEATSRGSKSGNPSGGSSWLSSLIATIIGNLKITISNVHVRYEDSLSNPGHPFSSGVTLAKLAAVTTDEHGNETFDTSGALDRLRKSLYLQRLALYHDSDSSPWMLQKKWEELSPMEWVEIFADGINKSDGDKDFSSREKHRKYLVSPINGVLNYHRLGKQENHDPDVPLEKAALVLTDVSLTILETQYYDVIKLLETLSRYKTRVNVSHLRPVEPLSQNTYLWWRYAVQATLQQKKMCYRFSWERIRQLCHLRRRYVQLYATSLQLCTKEDNYQIRQIEKDLDSKVILLWRLLAHAKVESVKSKEASQQSGVLKRSWWSFGWHTASDDASIPYSPSGEQFSEEKLSKEEWQVLNKMLSYDPDEDNIPISGKVMQTMIQFLVDISIEKAAARIVSIDQMEVLYGRFEQLRITTRFYYKSIHCELSLRYCGLSSPEGSLAQSVSNEKKENALAATFVHSPVGDKVDWSLSATIAPCHVTVFMKSYERFLGFMKRSNAVSPTVALETAAALQMKIEQVTRKAQEQFQMVLEEQSRFNLDIDFDAPKVRVPFGDCSSGSSHGNFLLDFGHFTLHTREDEHDERRESIYSRFTIFGKDIAAFFSDGCSEDCRHSSTHTLDDQHSILCTHSDNNDFHSLIDRCRMSVVVDQIKVPHPSYPSTRISIEVPKLGIHFSPTRYQRFFDLLDIFYGSVEVSDQEISAELMHPDLAPWYPADLASEARVLVWRGIGNSLAEWRPCFLVLSGLYLYVLESEISQSYQRCCSMGGRSVFEVPPASVGGSFFSVAVSLRGSDVQKALESSSTLIIEFRNEVEKTKWLKGLIQATYQASAFPLVDVPGKLRNDIDDAPIPSNAFQRADLVINGSLFEAKLSIYGKFARNEKCPKEELIVDILAGGGKVNLARTSSDLSLKLKLHFLKIRDELQGQNSVFSQYLACSVVKHNFCPDNSALSLCDEMLPKNLVEEDDIFRDALPNFVSAVHQNFDDQPLDIIGDSFSGALDECELCSHHNFRDDIHCGNTKCRGKLANAEVFYEAEDDGSSDFVVLTFFSRYPDSPLYDGIDTQMSICMSKLDFFCNRPTVVALLDFGFDLSLVNSSIKSTNSIDDKVAHSSNDRERAEDSGRSVVKGLLGYGKRRIVFYLRMAVDSVCVFLNKEDGSQFAMFVQERFLFDFKVHPSSTSLKSTLGNFRLCDMSLGPDHCWGWLCDVRDHRSESLIKFTFRSFSADDDDYTGHDYSLSGELSAVRIVFLYRFVQEVMAYFMELATPHTEEVIKFVDKVGGFEWLIKKYEIDGASSIKLDLSLDTPVIVVPYSSMSQSFMQFDLGKLQITNSLRWHGEEKDPSAVHLDILHAEMRGINLAVGVNGEIGEPMIEEGQQLQIEVRRSLRDIFRKVPMACVEVKVGSLHCVMSDKEYRIIRDCAYTNISEIPSLPPTFRGNTNATDSIRMLADKVNFNTQILLSRTVVIMAVHVQHALLELRNGRYEESPLAQIVLEGLWVSYRSTSLSEADLYVTIPKFSILDIRPDIKPEMRSMLGSSSDAYKQGVFSSQLDEPSSWTCSDVFPSNAGEGTGSDIPNLTMLIMDYRWRPSSQSFVIRMQQPRVLVVLDFLVSVAEFFVPSLRSITGSEELVDPKNDPLSRTDNIIVSEPLYMQKADIIHLSPARKLIVDGPGFDEVIYDGCGGTIHVSEECETYDHELSGYCKLPFSIIVGRGKMLRFKNVKIENGTLLSKHTYLGNDSSYSVSAEDGVQISLPDNFSADVRHTNSQNLQSLSECRDVKTVNSDVNSAELQSFSFEAQVVSPELTFYDSSGVFLEDAMHVEKLLRAKMDFSFMYASKGNDIWVRSHVKDFAIESGSGLTVLAPLDISGGYTSVKDKANISIISTDVCIHLSLSVASLILRLQHQAFTALQFGNMDPVTSCTNFKRIWVSQEGNKFGYNLTFWRPQAPLNYAILGDCVTSRPIPPSQIVMAVSNSYGRVRKPIGFKLIGLISDLLVPDGGESQTDVSSDCSIWMPIAPPGYLALGCVAHVGRHPPPNHAVYCIRSDLVTSATFSDCIINIPSNNRAPSGFSIWRVYNAACSFYAHSLVGCPSTSSIFDLHHILLGDISLSSLTNTNKSTYNQSDLPGDGVQLGNEYTNTISRWDILRAFSKPGSCYISTPHFERVWWDKGCDFRKGVSFWRPLPRQGFCVLGDFLAEGLEPPTLGILFKCDSPEISAKPMQFTKVAHVTRKGLDDAYFWYPIPPPGYASLGCVLTKTDEPPCKESVCCPRMDLVSEANISEYPLFKSSSSKGSNCWSVWKIENQANTFLARPDHKRPSSRLAYALSDYVKPKSRENISAEMKIGTLSLTIIDGLCGMMTPLFDLTITSINLATHGQFEAMNAALICSVAASTFNRQLETWEPLVEPFEGIFKVETYDTNENALARVGKRIRIAATSIVNLNLSAGNLETLAESVVSWRKQADLEQKTMRKSDESNGCQDSTFSALDEDDFEKVILENKLGCDLYLKKVVEGSDTVVLLSHGNEASVSIPPPRFSDRLNVITETRANRSYVAINIFHAKGLPIEDDGNGLDFFCALRLVIDGKTSNRSRLFPQSARTRCVKPLISKINDTDVGIARWNEIFLFEVPDKVLATLELEITNLASKTGKGEVVGALSIPVRKNVSTLKRISSIRMMLDLAGSGQQSSYPLKRRGQVSGKIQDCGCLYASTAIFERSSVSNFHGGAGSSPYLSNKEVGFWVGLCPEGPWESFGSLLPLSVSPKLFDEKPFAFEVTMRNGCKHAIFRPLALIVNDANVKLEVSLCPASTMGCAQSEMRNNNLVGMEEIFENQWYHPTSGWGSKWTGHQSRDPANWSTRDFSYSSKDYFNIPLPPGWRWTSAWTIEKTELMDSDGWAYGTDFQSLTWPPSSSKSHSKSPQDFVRRRRWIRTREQLSKESTENARNIIAIVSPGSSAPLPWSSMTMDLNLCLQIRPYDETSGIHYSWGEMFSITPTYNCTSNENFDQSPFSRQNTIRSDNFRLSPSALTLNQLGKMDFLLCCDSSVSKMQHFWLTVGTDASVLQTEVNVPVYDWKITINSPLKVENKLPYPAEFYIWEKTVEGNNVERQYGIVPSGNSFYVYSADLQKPIYLTLFIQNDWAMEKDAVLIMDLLCYKHSSSFWMVNKQSKRRLRVSVEHDIEGTIATPKTIRLFVPYWIQNNSSVPLSYRIVEVEYSENGDVDAPSISKAVKSAKSVLRHTSSSLGSSRRFDQILEVIEEPNSPYIMLSPQDYSNHIAISHHQSHELLPSQHIGISVAVCHSECYGPGISLYELENKERVDIKAFASSGSYYKLSAMLSVTSDRTKVVCFQPQTLFINRIGCNICLKQSDNELVEWLHPMDVPKLFKWQSGVRTELLKLRMNGCKWSSPFSVGTEGLMCISLMKDGDELTYLWIEVRSSVEGSRYEVIFRPVSFSSPYRIENRSLFLNILFRQVDCHGDFWRSLPQNSSTSFCWEDLGRRQLLEILVEGSDPSKSEIYNIDNCRTYQPVQMYGGPMMAIRVSIFKDGKMHVVRIDDWRRESQDPAVDRSSPAPYPQSSEYDSTTNFHPEFHVTLELAELGLSIIDHTPEEILYLSVQNLLLSYSTGLGSGVSRFKLRIVGLQVDNQLPFTPMPVLFRSQRIGEVVDDYVLKFSLTMQSSSQDLCMYPYIGIQGPENSAFLVNIHEPIIWRLHEMIKQGKLSRMYSPQSYAVPIDPTVQIRLLNISEFRFKLSMSMSPNQRPGGVLGFWSSLMTALGNMENMTVRINQRSRENVCMRQSTLVSTARSSIRKDLLSQPLRLLSGVDILGNASSALGHMSKGVAALSMDKKFIQSRQKQESKTVEDFGDVIREGGGALAKGLFRGVTGILTKPLEGAKSSGVEGFVQGVGKGIIGVAAQPVSGVLDLLSKTTEGANAMRMKIASTITSEEQLRRRRLPRAIGGDSLLKPYDEYKATGLAILQLAESGTFFGQVDFFKVRGKFALSDAYEDHFLLPKGKIILVTHRRVLQLQQPTNIVGQRKFNPARDPCSVLWDVLWDDLMTRELAYGNKDPPTSPSRLILYPRMRPTESRENIRVIKCRKESQQANEIYASIERAMNIYGPNRQKEMRRENVTKPYTPCTSAENARLIRNEASSAPAIPEVPSSISMSSSFGTVNPLNS